MPLSEAAELIVKPGQFLKDDEQDSVNFSTFITGGISRKVRDNQNGLNGEMEPISLIILRREPPKQQYLKHIGEV